MDLLFENPLTFGVDSEWVTVCRPRPLGRTGTAQARGRLLRARSREVGEVGDCAGADLDDAASDTSEQLTTVLGHAELVRFEALNERSSVRTTGAGRAPRVTAYRVANRGERVLSAPLPSGQ